MHGGSAVDHVHHGDQLVTPSLLYGFIDFRTQAEAAEVDGVEMRHAAGSIQNAASKALMSRSRVSKSGYRTLPLTTMAIVFVRPHHESLFRNG